MADEMRAMEEDRAQGHSLTPGSQITPRTDQTDAYD